MKAFDFDNDLITHYERFSRSFTKIHARDLREAIEAEYQARRFWPDSLLSINPRFEEGPSIDDLVSTGELDEATGRIFRRNASPLRLYKHQSHAVAKAKAGQSFVVTTGTGSGKSLCFFIPIVDAVVRALKADKPRKTRAIIIYPMNALANSQIKEIDKYISQSDLPAKLKPVVKRYTGQEGSAERKEIAANPPDILLTNFMMAELLLTRQDEQDSSVIENASGLEFIVLDELHTYRGRQGADVAVLVRRLRNRCAPDKEPVYIGTSATMASEGSKEDRAANVAKVASRLFGASIGADAVIDESLRRATDDSLTLEQVKPLLASVVTAELPETLTDETLRRHPLAVWTELAIGLKDGRKLERQTPVPFNEAAERLSRDSGVDPETCGRALRNFLTRVSLPESARGGVGSGAFLAFKLHRFISGAGEIFTSLASRPRRVLFEGQLEDPKEPGTRLYPTRFCRNCGQEVHVVTLVNDSEGRRFLPRGIDDTPRDDEDGGEGGYLTPVAEDDDADYIFRGDVENYPEDWKEERNGVERLRSNRKERALRLLNIGKDGRVNPEGQAYWFIPGSFGFCPRCHEQPPYGMRERSKLAGLSGEGRSSATTLLVSSALEWMNREDNGVPADKRKLLGFTDNRQDAALQAGHFNDFIFVSLLRGAILRAVLDAGAEGIGEDEFGLKVLRALHFTADNKRTRRHWMLDPEAGAVKRQDAQRALAKILAHRVWTDLRRGWRYTNPNLLELKLIKIEFAGLDAVAEDAEALASVLPSLADLDPGKRREFLRQVLHYLLEGQAIHTEALDKTILDGVARNTRNLLCAPWAMDRGEIPRGFTTMLPNTSGNVKNDLREEQGILRAGPNSLLGRRINRESVIGKRLKKEEYLETLAGLMRLLSREGLVQRIEVEDGVYGWRLSPSTVRIVPGDAALSGEPMGNPYFTNLYRSIAGDLKNGWCSLWGLEGREHTAQVSQKQREWREWRFRSEQDDLERIEASVDEMKTAGEPGQFLPALFCSPTMELGVDISALNAVYLRNVPPTPANYAQRAGRAGRSGQAAVIVTYCAAQSPHDQYFFTRRHQMVDGQVRPPALDITNEELVRSHLHAVWLAETKLALSPNIPEILDLSRDGYPLKAEVLEVIRRPELVSAASAPMRQVLEQIIASNDHVKPSWLDDAEAFIREVAEKAPDRFDEAFTRWRDLYRAAHGQLAEANAKSVTAGLTSDERKKVKAAQAQANDQITLLEQGASSSGSDFYSYRYLATEGFLPGYNFPRLPLYAFIPGDGKAGAFLQRARFLAISEFGPRSLIYHEGRAYRVVRAKLPPEVRNRGGEDLATKDIFICPNCGGCHEEEMERCHACDSPMAGQTPVRRTLRIDNVEAIPAERISANDEERVRQGFDIQTVFSWPRRDGRLDVTEAEFLCGGEPLMTLQYANSAEISRINKGLKRRKKQTVFGFNIDPRSGQWAKSEDDEASGDTSPDAVRVVRVVPIVRDRKNALLLRVARPEKHEPGTLATLQHALLRGIELEYQLEQGEILGEPLPARDNRRAILMYEAAEGGAGVLNQLIEDPGALRRVARAALTLTHFDNVDEAIAAGDDALLKDQSETCVRGCYRCLLSYYNQTDHELIDRSGPAAKRLLIDIARGELRPAARILSGSGDGGEGWPSVFKQSGLPAPDPEKFTFAGLEFPYAWRGARVLAAPGPIPPEVYSLADDKGWTLFELPPEPSARLPEALLSALKS